MFVRQIDVKSFFRAMIKVVAFVSVVFLAALPAGSVPYFVAPDGDDTVSRLEWQSAFRTISNAVAKADVTEIVLSNGTEHNWSHDGTDMTYTNCCTITLTGLTGPDNIDFDPKFVSVPGYNFRLKGSSPCIDAGSNQLWMDDATDLDGNPRKHDGGTVDIGAYECIPPPAGMIFEGW